jgi:hypothetical protein
MTETKRDFEIGCGKPPAGRRFKKGESGNPSGGCAKEPPAPLLVLKFDDQVVAANGGRQKTTRREVVMVQLVEQPAGAGLFVRYQNPGRRAERDRKEGRPVVALCGKLMSSAW